MPEDQSEAYRLRQAGRQLPEPAGTTVVLRARLQAETCTQARTEMSTKTRAAVGRSTTTVAGTVPPSPLRTVKPTCRKRQTRGRPMPIERAERRRFSVPATAANSKDLIRISRTGRGVEPPAKASRALSARVAGDLEDIVGAAVAAKVAAGEAVVGEEEDVASVVSGEAAAGGRRGLAKNKRTTTEHSRFWH